MLPPSRVERTHEGRLLKVDRLFYAHPSGEIEREVVRHPGAVVILPIRARAMCVLIRNHRMAIGEHLLEVPAGTLEPGEDPRAAAGRELEEETGYRAGTIEPLCTFYTSPGFCDERIHAFVAEDLHPVGQRLDPGESIEVVEIGMDEVLAMIDDGRIHDAKTMAAVLLWDRRLRTPSR